MFFSTQFLRWPIRESLDWGPSWGKSIFPRSRFPIHHRARVGLEKSWSRGMQFRFVGSISKIWRLIKVMAAFSKSRSANSPDTRRRELGKIENRTPLDYRTNNWRSARRRPRWSSPASIPPSPSRNFVVFAVRLPRECVKQCVEKRPIPNFDDRPTPPESLNSPRSLC